jgi:hypothetical protein
MLVQDGVFNVAPSGKLFTVGENHEVFIKHHHEWERIISIHFDDLMMETIELANFKSIKNVGQKFKIMKNMGYY